MHVKKTILLLLISLKIFGQVNLVPNGSFETPNGTSAPTFALDDFEGEDLGDQNVLYWNVARYNGDGCTDIHGAGHHPCSSADWRDPNHDPVAPTTPGSYNLENGCTSQNYPNDRFVSMESGTEDFPLGPCHHSTGIRVGLSENGNEYSLIQGRTYVLKMKIRSGSPPEGSMVNRLRVHFSTFSENWNANPTFSSNHRWLNATGSTFPPSQFIPCNWYQIEFRFAVPTGSDYDELKNMILFLDDESDEHIHGELAIDDVELYDEGCCPEYMLYENTSNLPELTHVAGYIVAGFDAGIPNTEGNVIVQTGQNITFKAGSFIDLKQGFISGPNFLAFHEQCNEGTHSSGGQISLQTFPNVLTPNGDGINDVYCITQTGAQSYHIQIRNRFGDLIFDQADVINANHVCIWNGDCFNCSGSPPSCDSPTPCSDGTYYPVLTLSNCSESQTYTTDVELSGSARYSNSNDLTNFEGKHLLNSEERLIEKGFIVVPNPNLGIFTIESGKEISSITITDMIGEEILQTVINSTKSEIDLSAHAKGIYFIRVRAGSKIFSDKIIIQ